MGKSELIKSICSASSSSCEFIFPLSCRSFKYAFNLESSSSLSLPSLSSFFYSVRTISTKLMPTRINIINRIPSTVSIQVQPISTVGIFLGKPSYHWIVIACAQIILLRYWIILLSIELKRFGTFSLQVVRFPHASYSY